MKPNPYADAPRLPEGESIDPRELVGAGLQPIELEIGPGRGGFMFERLAAEPAVRIVGLEIRRKWASIVDARLRARGYGDRARVFAEDARDVVPKFAPESLAVVYLHFPDPWWKKKHQKRLVMAPDFASVLVRALVRGGGLFLQTDVEERALAYEDMLSSNPGLVPAGAQARTDENPFSARSPRERRALTDGLPVYRLYYRRAATP
jgi:tRNA (guanine-N7-)-methyltransferase